MNNSKFDIISKLKNLDNKILKLVESNEELKSENNGNNLQIKELISKNLKLRDKIEKYKKKKYEISQNINRIINIKKDKFLRM